MSSLYSRNPYRTGKQPEILYFLKIKSGNIVPHTTAFRRAASRNHSALSFGMRCWVSKST